MFREKVLASMRPYYHVTFTKSLKSSSDFRQYLAHISFGKVGISFLHVYVNCFKYRGNTITVE